MILGKGWIITLRGVSVPFVQEKSQALVNVLIEPPDEKSKIQKICGLKNSCLLRHQSWTQMVPTKAESPCLAWPLLGVFHNKIWIQISKDGNFLISTQRRILGTTVEFVYIATGNHSTPFESALFPNSPQIHIVKGQQATKQGGEEQGCHNS